MGENMYKTFRPMQMCDNKLDSPFSLFYNIIKIKNLPSIKNIFFILFYIYILLFFYIFIFLRKQMHLSG